MLQVLLDTNQEEKPIIKSASNSLPDRHDNQFGKRILWQHSTQALSLYRLDIGWPYSNPVRKYLELYCK